MKKIFLSSLISFSVFLIGCQDEFRVFEKNEELSEGKWERNYHPTFEFDIQDTTITYNILFNVRNTMDYQFSNLYLNYSLEDSLGNIELMNQTQVFLFDKEGKPTGEKSFLFSPSIADIFDHHYLCVQHQFKRAGIYRVKLKQYMRNQDPLEHILAVGVRVEKAK